MRSTAASLLGCVLFFGCAPSPAHSPSPTVLSEAPRYAPIVAEMASVSRIPRTDPQCPLFFPPHNVGSVVIIPGQTMAVAMNPVVRALCSCTNPAEFATIVARIDFEKGHAEVTAPENAAINECLAQVPVSFAPVPEGDVPSSDCIGCGPRYYGVFADSPPPPKKQGLHLIYSFLLDRTSEVLKCPAETHAERGECRSDVVVAKPEKKTCGCSPQDLNCAMVCAASH